MIAESLSGKLRELRWFSINLSIGTVARAVNAGLAVPQHYGDLPNFTKDASGFAAGLKKFNIPFYEMKPGETLTFRGAKLEKR